MTKENATGKVPTAAIVARISLSVGMETPWCHQDGDRALIPIPEHPFMLGVMLYRHIRSIPSPVLIKKSITWT